MGLFSKSKSEDVARGAPATASRESTFFGVKLSVKGKISGAGDVIVMGRLEGELDLSGELVLAQSAAVNGEIKAVTINVSGSVTGNLVAREKVQLEKAAIVNGRLTTPRLSIMDGACFNGELEMKKPPGGSATTKPPEKK